MPSIAHDVVVIGGGPGGLFVSLRLAEAGFDVAMLEEHQTVGAPVHCTGILAREAFDEFHLPTDVILNELRAVCFYSPSGKRIEHSALLTEAVVIDRLRFDNRLSERAARAGVRLLPGSRVTGVTVDESGVSASVAGRDAVRARVSVLACGASYKFQRRFGLGLPPALLQSAQAEIPACLSADVEVHFGHDVAPRGFAWAVPVSRPDGPHVRVGVMCSTDSAGHFNRMLERIRDRWQPQVDAGLQPRHKIIPLAPIARTYADRLVVLGDAAGLVKATTGGGIYYSLISAALAAETIATALHRGTTGAETLRAYEVRWRKRLQPELRAQLALRRLAERLSDDEIEELFELARTDGIMPIVRRTARFNHHRPFILALFRHPPARNVLFRARAS